MSHLDHTFFNSDHKYTKYRIMIKLSHNVTKDVRRCIMRSGGSSVFRV